MDDIERLERLQFCRKIIMATYGTLDVVTLHEAMKKDSSPFFAINDFLYKNDITHALQLWEMFRSTPAATIIIKEFLHEYGFKWCIEHLQFDQIKLMAVILGNQCE